ncbi:hypothetical protein LQW54_002444 [Pestalotiopsis sp. IQ-011]
MATELLMREEDIEFGIPLDEGSAEDEYQPRIKNMGKVQRRRITGYDRREPMVVYGVRDLTIHGTNSAGTPCSLVVFRWYLHQRNSDKRLKSLRISITFATQRVTSDGNPDGFYHPHVAAVAPNGTFGLMPTVVKNESTVQAEGSLDVGFGGPSAGAKLMYELSQSFESTKQITINGTECYDYGDDEQTDPDRCNAVEWNLFENAIPDSGLPTFFRTAVLLERRDGDASRFTAKVSTEANVDAMANAKAQLKKLFGAIPKDDPIVFDPSVKEDARHQEFELKLDELEIQAMCKFIMYKLVRGAGSEVSH